MDIFRRIVLPLMFVGLAVSGCKNEDRVVQRPERVVSKREVLYEPGTYAQLDSLWKEYNGVYPSEEAYANWMYAARYAGNAAYASLLEEGLKLYPANPRLLYLKSMVHHGKPENLEALTLLERAVDLDPTYTDPWFALVIHYLERGEREKTNVALRKLLEAGAVADEVMDFSYNMLAGLEKNAVLVTNGDNDTYPGWILTRVVGYRPDVLIVNQSLLNTNWYVRVLESDGLPNLASPAVLDSLEAAFARSIKEKKLTGQSGPFSDLLIERLIGACSDSRRPVYFAATFQPSVAVERFLTAGRDLGLVTLVTPTGESDASQLRKAVDVWVRDFRTGGLDGWGLRYAKHSRAGKVLIVNYAAAMHSQMDRIKALAPDRRLDLFRWYRDHLADLIPAHRREKLDRMWCRSFDIGEIKAWCQAMNLLK